MSTKQPQTKKQTWQQKKHAWLKARKLERKRTIENFTPVEQKKFRQYKENQRLKRAEYYRYKKRALKRVNNSLESIVRSSNKSIDNLIIALIRSSASESEPAERL